MTTRTAGLLLIAIAVLVMAQPARAGDDSPWVEYTTSGIVGASSPGMKTCTPGAPPGEHPPECPGAVSFLGNEIVTNDPLPEGGVHISSFDGSAVYLISSGYCVGVLIPSHATGSIVMHAFDQFGESMFLTSPINLDEIVPELNTRYFGACSDDVIQSVLIADPTDGLVQYDAVIVGSVKPWIVEKCAGLHGYPYIIVHEEGLPPRVIEPEANGCAYYTPWHPDQAPDDWSRIFFSEPE